MFSSVITVLPRQTIFYDIVQYLYTQKMSPQLLDELPALLALPLNEDVQLNQIRIISQLRYVSMGRCISIVPTILYVPILI